MPQFPWQKGSSRSSRPSHSSSFYVEGQQQHPDLPLPSPRPSNIQRSTSVHNPYIDNRRSVALFSSSPNPSHPETSTNSSPSITAEQYFPPVRSPVPGAGIARSHTVVYREQRSPPQQQHREFEQQQQQPSYEVVSGAPSPVWAQDPQLLPSPRQQHDPYYHHHEEEVASMNSNNTTGKSSSDSGSTAVLDRWSQRRLQRLNTEQGFREQRQGGGVGGVGGGGGGNSGAAILSATPGSGESHPFPSSQQSNSYTALQQHEAQPQSSHQQSQPQQQSSYPSTRSGSNAGLNHQLPSNNNTHTRSSPNNYSHEPVQQQYSPPDAVAQYQAQHNARNNAAAAQQQQQQTRTYQSSSAAGSANAAAASDTDPMSLSNGNAAAAAKAARSGGILNRQSVHTELLSRDASTVSSQGVPAFNASVVPPTTHDSIYDSDSTSQQNAQAQPPDPRRPTPQPAPTSEEMSEDDINQLVKDHKELREKYTKVKKYYFEKEDQVKQLQNSLAHQRLSQSRTSLDDSEYTTRFNRLDGLIAQLAFSIRKSWRSLPGWLANSVNKDAVITGKQEMTAAGRAFISCWLVEEVFDKYFHPDLEPALSAQLKSIQKNIRRFATPAQTAEEEDYLIAKVVNWRLATLEGLQDALRSPQCPTFRAQLTDMLKEHLCGALAVHLQEPPPSDLEGGVHMIVELVVSIAIHLPLESRDVVIEYFMPSHNIVPDQMKLESGIPALTVSIADDTADRASLKSASSDLDESVPDQPSKKRGMLSALTGTSSKTTRNASSQQKSSAGASSSSLQRPESSAGKDEPPRVRMAAGIGVSIRGRSVLVKAPVFST